MLKQMLVCWLLFFAMGASLARPDKTPEISLAFYRLGALYYHTTDGRETGIDKDVVEELAKRTGYRFKTVVESRVRIWTHLAGGTLDMSVSGIATPERERFARFIPYFATRNYALLRRGLLPVASTAEGFLAIAEYKVAVVKSFKHGDYYDIWLNKLRAQGRVYEAADFDAALRLLKVGRVHAILALPTSWVPALKQEALGNAVRVLDWSPKDRTVHGLILSRERIPEVTADRMAMAIQSMRNDGTLLTIFRRHVGSDLASSLLDY